MGLRMKPPADPSRGAEGQADSASILLRGFDGIVCDLDGVVYRGRHAVPHAVESLLSAMSAGVRVVYATNNASRTPAEVADHLHALGLPGPPARVVTSAQAAARHLAQRFPVGARVLAVGGAGVALALEEAGLVAVSPEGSRSGPSVVAVVQGYGPDVAWTDLAEVAHAVQAGASWVATNTDRTVPTARGLAPGNGTLVAAVRAAVTVDPLVVGKPFTPLYELCASVLGTESSRTLAVGDRLDTDIAGATVAGLPSLFVFGGAHGWSDVARAEPAARPHYVATDLRSLHAPYPEVVKHRTDPSTWSCGVASASVSVAGELVMASGGGVNERVRAALSAIWSASDVRGSGLDPLGGDGAALSREVDVAVGR